MQEVTDPNILAQLNQGAQKATQPTSTSGLKEVTDPELLTKLNQTTGTLGKIDATALGHAKGTIEAIGSMGTLANNLLKGGADLFYGKLLKNPEAAQNVKEGLDLIGTAGQKLVSKASDFFEPTTDFEKQAVSENPRLYGMGGMVGNVGTQAALTGAASTPLTGAINKGLETVAPVLGKAPIIKGIINQEGQAALLGAGSDPEHPVQGAIRALPYGLFAGIASGALEPKLARSGDIMKFEQDNARQAGIDPNSFEGINRVKNALKNNGVDYAKYKVGQGVSSGVHKEVSAIAPSVIDGEMPAETLTRIASGNYKEIKGQVDATLKPLNESTQVFIPENTKAAATNLDSKTISKLPQTPLPENATFSQMWNYRKELDGNIQVLQRQAKKSVLAKNQAVALQDVRTAVTNDMLTSADQLGLKENFIGGEKLWKEKLLPYQTFKTDAYGKVLSQKATDDIMTKFNKFTMAKANMNIADIKSIAKTLGPEGNKTMGWALLQRATADASDAKGIVNAKTLFNKVKKYNNIGVFNVLKDDAVKHAARGIQRIADGADEMVRQGAPVDIVQAIYNKVPSLLGSTAGRTFLTVLGGSSPTKAAIRHIINQVVTTGLVINNVSGSQQQNQQQ